MPIIEYANQSDRFTSAEFQAKVRESRAFWSSPKGQAAQRKLDIENRNRKLAPAKYPKLAECQGTKPRLTVSDARIRLLGI